MHDLSSNIKGATTQDDNYRMALSAYNGGIGGLRKERLKCSLIPNCNPNIWFGNVELSSIKSRKPFKGYGQSPYDINRGYIKLVYSRAKKYEGLY
jgi:membrane-bound lytic murein transglycosylase MltF